MLLPDSVPELRQRNSKTKRSPTLNSDRHPEYLSPGVIPKCLAFLASFTGSSLVNLPFHARAHTHTHNFYFFTFPLLFCLTCPICVRLSDSDLGQILDITGGVYITEQLRLCPAAPIRWPALLIQTFKEH